MCVSEPRVAPLAGAPAGRPQRGRRSLTVDALDCSLICLWL